MTIKIEKESNNFFLVSSALSSEEMKCELAVELSKLIVNQYKIYLFLCSDVWQPNTRIVRYLKMKKQEELKIFFEKRTNIEEFEFFNSTQTSVMFACVIELSSSELIFGIERCASNSYGHSFLFTQCSDKRNSLPHVADICYHSEILIDSHSLINWSRLAEFLKRYEITVLQKWFDSHEHSLRFYNLEPLKIFRKRHVQPS